MDKIINISKVSKKLTGNRTQITWQYKGKKYKSLFEYIKIIDALIGKRIEDFKEDKF